MQESRKNFVSFIDPHTTNWLYKVRDEQIAVTHAKHEEYQYAMYWYNKIADNNPQKANKPKLEQSYSHLLKPKKFRPKTIPSEIYRNAIVYRFYLPWQLHRKNPDNFGEPKRDKCPRSVILTRELFTLKGNKLTLKNRRKVIGELTLNIHRECPKAPNMICIKEEIDGSWNVTFPFENDAIPMTAEDVLAKLQKYRGLSIEDIVKDISAYDLGVVIGCINQHGVTFGWTPEAWKLQQEDQDFLDELKVHLSRKVVGSTRYVRVSKKIAKLELHMRNRTKDMNEKGSFAISQQEGIQAMETANWANMLHKAKPVHNGYEYKPNGNSAKAGLNRAIKGRSPGQLVEKTTYKVIKNRKIMVLVPSYATSITCRICGHRHRDNRLSQALFHCQKCKHTENADKHASGYMAKLTAYGIQLILHTITECKGLRLEQMLYLLNGVKDARRVNEAAYVQLQALARRVNTVVTAVSEADDKTSWRHFLADTRLKLPGNPLVTFGLS